MTRAQLKSFFTRGAKPTAGQFASWIDSFWHKDEDTIPINKIGNLSSTLAGKVSSEDLQSEATIRANADEDLQIQINELAESGGIGYTAENVANKNQANGYAGLDETGKVSADQLPSYVDDVMEFANFAALPAPGEAGKIYITTDNNNEYRWSGSTYIQIVASPGTTDAVPEGSTNKYFTVSRVLNSLLTGIGFGSSTAVAATDNILQAFGKLQAQITALFKIPTGGTAGQILAKNSNADGDVKWINAPSGGGGGGITAVTSIGTNENASISGSTLNIPNMMGGVWKKFGTVMTGDLVADQVSVLEATVIYEGNPQVLTSATGNVFKMWFTAGASSPNIAYAESTDGLGWTRSTTFCVTGHARSSVVKVGSTYYMYAVSSSSSYKTMNRYTSPDGINWTLGTAAVITCGAGGSWNGNSIANSSVYYDGAIWQMLLEANSGGTDPFTIGYYHSTDGITWTQHSANPVLGNSGTLNFGGPYLTKVGSIWYVWCHGGAATQLPCDIYSFSSTDLITWTPRNGGNPVYTRTSADEGVGLNTGGVGDATLVEVNGKTYLYYGCSNDGSGGSPTAHLKCAIANYSIANLVNTNEGNGGHLNTHQPSAYSKAASDLNFLHNASNANGNTAWDKGSLLLEDDAGAGVQVRNPTTPTDIAKLLPKILYLMSGGAINYIGGATDGLKFNSWGGVTFSNISGSGASNLFSVDNTGQMNINTIIATTLAAIIANTDTGHFKGVYLAAGTQASEAKPVRNAPCIYLAANSWNTGSSTSKVQEFIVELRPVSGSVTSSVLAFAASVESAFGAYTDVMTLGSDGVLKLTAPLQLKGYTVATLPAGIIGMEAYVTDANSPTPLAVVSGGGSTVVKVFFNGTNWIVQ
ncbi:hypothetical protein [Mucilaginibacter kameinonensis]|uniref:hypothetical protein n=1 Tax=Mucilaginibacter kameinonensis TaxID=452286 RepID=UPI000EF825A5|nr:hypothetical protein [Mucilaginibacter kameinonensis]